MRVPLLVLVTASALALAGCSAQPTALSAKTENSASVAALPTTAGDQLVGSWREISPLWGEEAPTSGLTLTFTAEGEVSGTTYCAEFSGTYSTDGTATRFADVVFVDTSCVAGRKPGSDAQLRSALEKPLGLSVTDGTLGFVSDSTRLVSFYEPVTE